MRLVKSVLCLAATLACLVQPVAATTPATCSADGAIAAMRHAVPDATASDVNASRYMPLFNALPPASHFVAPSRLTVLVSPRFDTVLLLGFDPAGCLTLRSEVKRKDHERIMSRIEQVI